MDENDAHAWIIFDMSWMLFLSFYFLCKYYLVDFYLDAQRMCDHIWWMLTRERPMRFFRTKKKILCGYFSVCVCSRWQISADFQHSYWKIRWHLLFLVKFIWFWFGRMKYALIKFSTKNPKLKQYANAQINMRIFISHSSPIKSYKLIKRHKWDIIYVAQ